ncbi:DIP13 [Symbiodinium natans]|uniref:DIP13 protein n=1 Tax=Symbiodinium natans TaxID=878477 RepID=A0A812QE23_9DINO|nr:DIP13 [Symbiodinium natans]
MEPDQDSQNKVIDVTACVPLRCATKNFVAGSECREIALSLLEELRDQASLQLPGEDADAKPPWLDGIRPQEADTGSRTYLALRATAAASSQREGPFGRVAVVGTHGVLSVLAAQYLQKAAQPVDLHMALYGQCQLCESSQTCQKHHVPSPLDAGCAWSHGHGNLEEEVTGAVQAFLRIESNLAAVVCFQLLVCHFLFATLAATVARLQVLGMNPLQGVPSFMATKLLAALDQRLESGDLVLASSSVTSALTAYHLNLPEEMGPPAMPFLSPQLRIWGLEAPWPQGQQVLFFRTAMLMNSPDTDVLEATVGKLWPYGVKSQPSGWDWEDQTQVSWVQQHLAVVFIPDHPFTNVFQDLCAMRLPIFVPSRAILAWLWPRLKNPRDGATYHGWFEKDIPRVMLSRSSPHHAGMPEPFNLDVDGEAKVKYWLRLAEYYHFPGVQVFHSLAGLIADLRPDVLQAARTAMESHLQVQTGITLSIFRALLTTANMEGGKALRRRAKRSEKFPSPQAPIFACMANSRDPLQASHDSHTPRRQLTAWRIRARRGVRLPKLLRLQVWRPCRVGWKKDGSHHTFRLVGEHRVKPTARTAAGARTLRVIIPEEKQFALRAGDSLAWAVSVRPGLSWDGWRRVRSASRFTMTSPGNAQAKPLCLGLDSSPAECAVERGICNFEVQQWLPSRVMALEVETAALPEKGTKTVLSIIIELPANSRSVIMMFHTLQNYVGHKADSKAGGSSAPAKFSFLVCPPETAKELNESVNLWSKVINLYDCAVGVSLRCAEARGEEPVAATEASERFLRALLPHSMWIILAGHGDESLQAARTLASKNEIGLGIVLQPEEYEIQSGNRLTGLQGTCANQMIKQTEFKACTMEFGKELEAPVITAAAITWLASSRAGRHWAPLVLRCATWSREATEGTPTEEEPDETLMHLAQLLQEPDEAEIVSRNAIQVIQRIYLREDLDISASVEDTTTYEEFLTLRQKLPPGGLSVFMDKIQFRTELLPSVGVQHTPTLYMSNTDPYFLPYITNVSSFVVKPSHLSESESVVVVQNGTYAFDIQLHGSPLPAAGLPVDKEMLQQHMYEAFNRTAFDWECQAVRAARPGVIVERMITARLDGASAKERVEEVRFHVVWGRTTVVEWAINRIGSTTMYLDVNDKRWHIFQTDMIWATTLGEAAFDDADAWVEAVQDRCLNRLSRVAERVALGAHVDHIRIDLFVEDKCDKYYVSEVELFPAVPLGTNAMIALERRWRHGYIL